MMRSLVAVWALLVCAVFMTACGDEGEESTPNAVFKMPKTFTLQVHGVSVKPMKPDTNCQWDGPTCSPLSPDQIATVLKVVNHIYGPPGTKYFLGHMADALAPLLAEGWKKLALPDPYIVTNVVFRSGTFGPDSKSFACQDTLECYYTSHTYKNLVWKDYEQLDILVYDEDLISDDYMGSAGLTRDNVEYVFQKYEETGEPVWLLASDNPPDGVIAYYVSARK